MESSKPGEPGPSGVANLKSWDPSAQQVRGRIESYGIVYRWVMAAALFVLRRATYVRIVPWKVRRLVVSWLGMSPTDYIYE